MAKPRADRWHRKPTALFGGVGIFGGFLVSYLAIRPASLAGDALIVLCATAMFLLGLVDDFVRLKPYSKLVAQIVIATALTTGGMRLHFLPTEVLDQGLSIFWLVAITNALNLLDNLDGLAGGVAVIAAAFLVYFCDSARQPEAAQIAAALCGASLGFLAFNFNPASIFMGDCGSLFLGFVLGSMGIVTTAPGIRRNVLAMLAAPVFVLLIPILDTTLVTLARSMHGRPVSQGGRDHTSHRLVALGFSERAAAFTLWGGSLAAGLLAILLQRLALPMTVFVIMASAMLLGFLGLFVGRVKVYAPAPTTSLPGRTLIPTLADFAYKRRVFEVLSDLAVVVMAYYGAFLLRFDGDLVEPHYQSFRASLPVVVAVQLSLLLFLGVYKGRWRQTTLEDLGLLSARVLGAWVATVAALAITFRLADASRAALVMDAILLWFGIAGNRLAVRWITRPKVNAPGAGRKMLIYGASDVGEAMLRLIRSDPSSGLVPVGFLDDDLANQGRIIAGLPVVGPLSRLAEAKTQQGVEEVALYDDGTNPDHLRQLCHLIQSEGLAARRFGFSIEPSVVRREARVRP